MGLAAKIGNMGLSLFVKTAKKQGMSEKEATALFKAKNKTANKPSTVVDKPQTDDDKLKNMMEQFTQKASSKNKDLKRELHKEKQTLKFSKEAAQNSEGQPTSVIQKEMSNLMGTQGNTKAAKDLYNRSKNSKIYEELMKKNKKKD